MSLYCEDDFGLLKRTCTFHMFTLRLGTNVPIGMRRVKTQNNAAFSSQSHPVVYLIMEFSYELKNNIKKLYHINDKL